MKNYLYYKQNNSEQYDPTTTNITNITAKETILLKCISCKDTYSDAYKCKDCCCPLYYNKQKWMKRPHSCSDWFRENRHSF
jgi:hypothetical protein